MIYETAYKLPNGATRRTSVYARDEAHLAETIALRGMDEEASGPYYYGHPQMASTLAYRGALREANHALVWASMIATRAGVTDAWALMNDEGLLHELAHQLHNSVQPFFDYDTLYGKPPKHVDLAYRLEAFELTVPGLHPRWADAQAPLLKPWEDSRRPQLRKDDAYFYMFGGKSRIADMVAQMRSGSMLMRDELARIKVREVELDRVPANEKQPAYTGRGTGKQGKRADKARLTQAQDAKAAMRARALAKLKPAKPALDNPCTEVKLPDPRPKFGEIEITPHVTPSTSAFVQKYFGDPALKSRGASWDKVKDWIAALEKTSMRPPRITGVVTGRVAHQVPIFHDLNEDGSVTRRDGSTGKAVDEGEPLFLGMDLAGIKSRFAAVKANKDKIIVFDLETHDPRKKGA